MQTLRNNLQKNLPPYQNDGHHGDGHCGFAVLLPDCRKGDEMKEMK